jgi:hypothetical protein
MMNILKCAEHENLLLGHVGRRSNNIYSIDIQKINDEDKFLI